MVVYILMGIALLVSSYFFAIWFRRASVSEIIKTGRWSLLVALLVLTAWLLVTGRFWFLVATLPSIAVTLWRSFSTVQKILRFGKQGKGKADSGTKNDSASNPQPRMTRREALQILGLEVGASPEEINEAYHKIISKIHPDHGGSNYLASQVNRARALLLRKGE